MATEGQRKSWRGSATLAALLAFAAVNTILYATLPKEEQSLTRDVIRRSSSEARQEGTWIWWVARDYLEEKKRPDIALMGSSQMGAAIYSAEAYYLKKNVDTVTYRKSVLLSDRLGSNLGIKAPEVFNFAIGGTMASDHLMIARALFRDGTGKKPKMVIVGINPRDFIDNTLPAPGETTTFRYLSPYVDLAAMGLDNKAFQDPLGWLDWKLSRSLPGREIGRYLAKTAPAIIAGAAERLSGKSSGTTAAPRKERERRQEKTVAVLQAVYGNQEEVKPGEWIIGWGDFAGFDDNSREYTIRYKDPNPPVYASERAFFDAYLKYLADNQIATFVVGMPSLWPNRALLPDTFWSDFRSGIKTSCSRYGATWVDLTADDDFDNTCFLDTVHLNRKGGTRLIEKISSVVAADRKLASVLEGARPAASGGEMAESDKHDGKRL